MGRFTGIISGIVKDSSRNNHPNTQTAVFYDKNLPKLKALFEEFEKKYGIIDEDLVQLIKQKPKPKIPISVFSNKKLSSLEATVKYLKENIGVSYSRISRLLNRDERTIWSTYNNSLKKSKETLDVSSKDAIPLEVISNRDHSPLGAICAFLREQKGLRYSEIARILCLDQRTIWTAYNRLAKKRLERGESK
ncbi:hypothetical protein GOV05_01505 [Candidatus Woesearchaeota archaeon]|nr:hypothetical protein [Candidatus Woesearchaeota archaeon]